MLWIYRRVGRAISLNVFFSGSKIFVIAGLNPIGSHAIVLAIVFIAFSGCTTAADHSVSSQNESVVVNGMALPENLVSRSTLESAPAPGARFRECPQCPEMIVIPPGRFSVGSKGRPDGQDDFQTNPRYPIPARTVNIDVFAVGIYDVTRQEYNAFVRESGRLSTEGCYIWAHDQWINDRKKNWHNPGFRQTATDPVTCVNWEDAQAYVRWLNSKVKDALLESNNSDNGPYRLLTWEEAEYATSAGALTAYYWGEQASRAMANYGANRCAPCAGAKDGRDLWLNTSPSEAFPPNHFGLYDMSGNVWQWTDHCNSASPSLPRCRYGFLHGGSWLDNPEYLRIAAYKMDDLLNRNNATGFRVARILGAVRLNTPEQTRTNRGSVRRAIFRDCPNCPEMVVIPRPGRFTLAESQGEPTAVARQAIIDKAYAIGIYDVSRDEYSTFVQETTRQSEEGCQQLDETGKWVTDNSKDWRHPGFAQTGRDPVVCVSWDDAQAYVQWLNGKIANSDHPAGDAGEGSYRLPSAVEWEYAARGGMMTAAPFYWGDHPSHEYANYGLNQCYPCGGTKEGRDRWNYTSPAGSFPPNVLGLYDSFGNVWQWTDECFHKDSDAASRNPPGPLGDDCRLRNLRGGSYDDTGSALQVAARNPFPAHVRNYANGFRVARTLN